MNKQKAFVIHLARFPRSCEEAPKARKAPSETCDRFPLGRNDARSYSPGSTLSPYRQQICLGGEGMP